MLFEAYHAGVIVAMTVPDRFRNIEVRPLERLRLLKSLSERSSEVLKGMAQYHRRQKDRLKEAKAKEKKSKRSDVDRGSAPIHKGVRPQASRAGVVGGLSLSDSYDFEAEAEAEAAAEEAGAHPEPPGFRQRESGEREGGGGGGGGGGIAAGSRALYRNLTQHGLSIGTHSLQLELSFLIPCLSILQGSETWIFDSPGNKDSTSESQWEDAQWEEEEKARADLRDELRVDSFLHGFVLERRYAHS